VTHRRPVSSNHEWPIDSGADPLNARGVRGLTGGLHGALGAGLGVELLQTADFALGVELAGTWLHLPGADWNSLGANLVMSFF
jgi:hypothetical protein